MTQKNKKILWSIVGATVVALLAMYMFVTPVHNWINSVIGRNERAYPKPDNSSEAEYEYGAPVEKIEGEIIDVPRDSILDSLLRADTATMGVVNPLDGPAPGHVEGFGEGPLPPAPSEDNLPNKDGDLNEVDEKELEQLEHMVPTLEEIVEIEQHTSSNAAVNKKIVACRNAFNKLLECYREYKTNPTPKLKADGKKQKDALLVALSQLMKLSQTNNDEAGMEEAADLRREVNKMEF